MAENEPRQDFEPVNPRVIHMAERISDLDGALSEGLITQGEHAKSVLGLLGIKNRLFERNTIAVTVYQSYEGGEHHE